MTFSKRWNTNYVKLHEITMKTLEKNERQAQ